MKKSLCALALMAGLSLMIVVASARCVVAYGDGFQVDTLQQISIVKDSVPVTTIVPVERGDVVVNDTVRVDSITQHLSRTERRRLRAEEFAWRIDSLVESRTFSFYPTTMQAVPEGEMRMVYAEYYYLLVSPMALEVHLPVERGLSQYISVLNFDNEGDAGLRPEKYGSRWTLSFAARYYDEEYHFDFIISTITGEVVLTLQSPNYSMRYIGQIIERKKARHHHPKTISDSLITQVTT
jgi:hypothetical protein